MKINEQQNNHSIRQIRKKRSKLNQEQKQKMEKIFISYLQPSFLDRQYQQLLVYGIPTEFRNYIWTQLIPNHYQITFLMYNQLLHQLNGLKQRNHVNSISSLVYTQIRRKQQKQTESQKIKNDPNPQNLALQQSKMFRWFNIIKNDIPRTFPELKYLNGNQYQQKIFNILGCFVLFRSDLGYIQGMSLLATLFLQQLNTQFRAFIALTTLATTTVLYDFYAFNDKVIEHFCQTIQANIEEKKPQIILKMKQEDIQIKILIIEWIMTLFSRIFQLDSILIIWDLLFAHKISPYILMQLCSALIICRQQHIIGSSQSINKLKFLKSSKLSFHEQQLVFEQMRAVPFNHE